MALLIKGDDIPALVPMREVIDATELAFADNARGLGPFYPRRVVISSRSSDLQTAHNFDAQAGSVSSLNVAAIRLMSGAGQAPLPGEYFRGVRRGPDTAPYQNRDWGLVLLFSLETAELLAILPQFNLSGVRVGATTGVAVKHIAREDASVVGVFGSGKIARADLEAIGNVRKLSLAKVYSPNPDHRADFAKELSDILDVEVVAVDDPRAVVEGSDIVHVSTKSNVPVFDLDWLTPGQLVTSTQSAASPYAPLSRSLKALNGPPPKLGPRNEVDPRILELADAVYILSEEMVRYEDQRPYLNSIEAGVVSWDKLHEVGDVVVGNHKVDNSPDRLLFYASTGGTGIQMAATGIVAYRNALKEGVGQEIPSEWFSSDLSAWSAKGYAPSP
jgi:ornithine cyclodeaminase/alanine dehydrogenase-like protein (mu-crystallin family)